MINMKMVDAFLARALDLAEGSVGVSEPNPRVGCVLTTADGETLGEGFTQEAGGPHAEVVAMRAARAAGRSLRGATAYVTLEPCSHMGRTPPCADALVAEGIAHVVVALEDPNPLVAGRGVAKLRAAGIDVDVLPRDASLAARAREINIGFLSRMMRGRPWVRVKSAISLDGRTALPNGVSQWITSAPARDDGHRWRARASAVMTGIGTILDDDPRLTVRAITVAKQPRRVVLDSTWRLPHTSAVLTAAPEGVLVMGLAGRAEDRREALARLGVETCTMSAATSTSGWQDHVSGVSALPGLPLDAVMSELGRREVNELHVEAGARLTGALIRGGWADELLVYQAPALVGPGLPMADFPALATLDDAPAYEWHDVRRVGSDLRLILRQREGWSAAG